MNQEAVAALVERELEEFQYEPSAHTVGVPWSAERVRAQVEELRAALIQPQLRPITRHPPEVASKSDQDLWVVAETTDGFLVFYEPVLGEFGLAVRGAQGLAVSIGVYGDLVGTFCAR